MLTISGSGSWAHDQPNLHISLALHVNRSARLTDKIILNQHICGRRNLYLAWHAMRLHSTGGINRITPDAIGHLFAFNNARHDRTRVNPDAKVKRLSL